YSIAQVLAVVMVTLGVILATISSSDTGPKEDVEIGTPEYVIGISLLSITLVISCFMGLFQELTYEKHKSDWRQVQVYNESASTPLNKILPVPDWFQDFLTCCTLPKSWIYLIIYVLTQYVCISGVHKLQSVVTALTLNLVLNLRKFTSLVISLWFFDNEFNYGVIIGGVLVFVGTLLYTFGANSTNLKTKEHSDNLKIKKDI
ncbi:23887_t:CDS:2, partial [Gigaspora margarita]